VGVWTPTRSGDIRCTKHDETFAKGKVCSRCAIDPPTEKEMAKGAKRARPPRRRGLPSPEDHEREFLAIAELAMEWAKHEEAAAGRLVPGSEDDEEGGGFVAGPSRSTAAKLLDCSIKARRAAVQLAQWREDWERTDVLEKAAREVTGRREDRQRQDRAEVRH
jgi:hypothetical protein